MDEVIHADYLHLACGVVLLALLEAFLRLVLLLEHLCKLFDFSLLAFEQFLVVVLEFALLGA